MKKFILYPILGLISLLLIGILTLAGILFFSPTTIINPPNIKWALEKGQVLKSFSWKDAGINHKWLKWNEREVSGHFTDFCLDYKAESIHFESCFEKISWNFHLNFDMDHGLHAVSLEPLVVYSEKTRVETFDSKVKEPKSDPPNIYRYWRVFWSDVVPDMDVRFAEIRLKSKEKVTTFDVSLKKKPKTLEAHALKFALFANPEGFELRGPDAYHIPITNKTIPPLYLRDFILKGSIKQGGAPLLATGAINPLTFKVNSHIDFPLKKDFPGPDFIEDVLLKTKAEIVLKDIRQSLKDHGPKKFHSLPAPFNAMNGDIITNITTQKIKNHLVSINSLAAIRLSGPKQNFDLDVGAEVPLSTEDFKPGAIILSLDFLKIALELPRISKKSLPPQFKPDNRIKAHFDEKKPAEEESDLSLHLAAEGEDALHLRTDLLDEDLRLNFDLWVEKGELQRGHLEILPLKTKVFKRPIRVQDMRLTFRFPLEPVVKGTILFPLPEYKITLKLEGPVSSPRHTFTSEPPLPQNDIYAVLLFGRPMSELDQDDKGAAQKTNQILSQGILSLSVLYFLAGSPVEYVGYDPESKNATAQVGLGSKTSLRVGAGSEGTKSTGVRRSLGKGWYLDTSVQSPNTTSGRDQNNYGVMLERVIAY